MKTLLSTPIQLTCCTFLALLLIGSPLQAQDLTTAKQVLGLHIKKIGGEKKLKTIKTISGEMTMFIPSPAGEMEADIALSQKGNRFLMTMNIPGLGEIKRGSDGKTFWSIDPFQGAKIMNENETALSKAQFSSPFPALHWADKFDGEIEFKDTADVKGNPCYQLLFKPTKGNEITRFFDVKSGQITRLDTTQPGPGGEIKISAFPSDFKSIDGIMVPHQQITETPQGEMKMQVESMKFNETIDDDLFVLPSEIQELVDEK